MGRMQRRKGHGFERAVARALRVVFPDAKRGLGQARGAEVADVDVPGWWPECKAHKRTNARAALAQAIEDSAKKPDRIPIAVCKDDGAHPTVHMRFEDFVRLLAELELARKHAGYDVNKAGIEEQLAAAVTAAMTALRA